MRMNKICHLFGIQYPIIQGGMAWCSGWRLASAVSNAGGLGLLGAGSMHPDTLREHLHKCRQATDKPYGVNVPLMYPEIESIMQILCRRECKNRIYFCRKSENMDRLSARTRNESRSCCFLSALRHVM